MLNEMLKSDVKKLYSNEVELREIKLEIYEIIKRIKVYSMKRMVKIHKGFELPEVIYFLRIYCSSNFSSSNSDTRYFYNREELNENLIFEIFN